MMEVSKIDNHMLSLKKITIFLVCCLFALLFEHAITHFLTTEWAAESAFSHSAFYNKFISAGSPKIRQNHTVIIDDSPDDRYKLIFPDIGGPCGEKGKRKALALLLEKIGPQYPSVIVLDHYFTEACAYNDPGTEALKTSILNISKQIPIVIGRLASTDEKKKENNTDNTKTIPYLESTHATLNFENSLPGHKIIEGILNPVNDTKKLPLYWSIKHSEKSNQVDRIPTLSFAAVQASIEKGLLNPKVTKDRLAELSKLKAQLEMLSKLQDHPFIRFIEPTQFEKPVPAVRLMLDDPSTKNTNFEDKIIIIGETKNLYDQWENTHGDKVPGMQMQANYIEAILENRFFKNSIWLDLIVGFPIFVLVCWADRRLHATWAFVLALCLIFLFSFLLLLLPVPLFGYYINPITISFLGVAIIISHRFFHILDIDNQKDKG
jgi:CHASE2 domain